MKEEFIYKDLTYQIRKAIFTVYNELGFGHKEQVYQKALSSEFSLLRIPFLREKSVNVYYKDQIVGTYRPDFIVDNKVIIELKAVEFMPLSYERQLLHYLKSTKYKLGFLVNFGCPKVYIKRLIWSSSA